MRGANSNNANSSHLLFGARPKGPGEQTHPEMQKILDRKEAERLEKLERDAFIEDGGTITVDEEGDTMWEDRNGNLHRELGPALVYEDGASEWFRYGLHHRIGGPAVDLPRKKKWYKNGRLHREDGPAVSVLTGGKWQDRWFVEDIEYSKEKFDQVISKP